MQNLYDPSAVTDKSLPSSFNPEDMGQAMNYVVFQALNTYFGLGTNDPSGSAWAGYGNTSAANMESAGYIPSGGATTVSDIFTAVTTASSVSSGVSALNTINNNALANSSYSGNIILTFTSIAYHSGVYWSQIKDSGGSVLPVANWIKFVCADIATAVGTGLGAATILTGGALIAVTVATAVCGSIGADVALNVYNTGGVMDNTMPMLNRPQDGGGWHNFYLFGSMNAYYDAWGTINPSLSNIGTFTNNLAGTLQSAGQLPSGSTTVIANIMSTISGATSISAAISSLNSINSSAVSNPAYTGSQLLCATSIAYHAGNLWSQVQYASGGANLTLAQWQKVVSAAVAGALQGISDGGTSNFQTNWWTCESPAFCLYLEN